ncbi:MAG TPA: hypothetical protein VHE35_20495 [Kofleriaceae bacterium]|nr:hypothetical protein [Kofleriaceae bacterium]
MRAQLERVMRLGNLGLTSRAVDLGQQLRAAFPELDLDPTGPSWHAARSSLVERFGADAIARYEAQFTHHASADGPDDIAKRPSQLVDGDSLERFVAMFPGAEVYFTGSAAQSKPLHAVTDIDAIIVVADDTPAHVRAEFEANARTMPLEAGFDYEQAVRKLRTEEGAEVPLIERFRVDAKVMTRSELAGWSMRAQPVGRSEMSDVRVDTPRPGSRVGTGDTGQDPHNHMMGVPTADYFIDRVGNGSARAALDRTWQIVNDPQFWKAAGDGSLVRTVKQTVMTELAFARADVANVGPDLPGTAVEARARRALEATLAASTEVPFDHTYDLRDLLVQAVIDPGGGPFKNFAKDTIEALHDQGVTYSEQSVSVSKLDRRFDAKTMADVHAELAAEGKDSDLRFLAMLSTDKVLSGKPLTPTDLATLERVLARADVMGIDIAGPEAQAFTEGGADNLASLVRLLEAAGKQRGRPLVLRPHVGEGYDPAGTGAHVEVARANLERTLGALEAAGYHGPADGVVVRLGHATHATPEQLQRIARLGIVVEANVGSNLATRSVTSAQEHPLLSNLYHGVDTILSTDAQGVMRTNLTIEYQRAAQLIELFRAGLTRLRLGDHDVAFAELPPELQRRFALDTLLDTARAYGARVRADDVHDRARQPTPP